jgi:hypothetical protein
MIAMHKMIMQCFLHAIYCGLTGVDLTLEVDLLQPSRSSVCCYVEGWLVPTFCRWPANGWDKFGEPWIGFRLVHVPFHDLGVPML